MRHNVRSNKYTKLNNIKTVKNKEPVYQIINKMGPKNYSFCISSGTKELTVTSNLSRVCLVAFKHGLDIKITIQPLKDAACRNTNDNDKLTDQRRIKTQCALRTHHASVADMATAEDVIMLSSGLRCRRDRPWAP